MEPETNPKNLGDLIRSARKKAGRSIDAMAECMEVNKNTQGGYERGQWLPGIDYLARFAEVTGVDLSLLLRLRLLAAGFKVGGLQKQRSDTPNEQVLTQAIHDLEVALAEENVYLPADVKAKIIVELYLDVAELGRGDPERARRLMRLVS